ncbi:MAG: hypothetical protein ACOH1N_12160 [Lutibacter sp.]
MKYQFLFAKQLSCETHLLKALEESVPIYNTKRPQWSLGGNTPFETHTGILIDFSRYAAPFSQQKTLRKAQNKQNSCKICM